MNRQERKEYLRVYREQNKDKINACRRAYRRKHGGDPWYKLNKKRAAKLKLKTKHQRKQSGLCPYCGCQAIVGVKCEICWLKTKSYKITGTNKHWKDLQNILEKQNYQCAYTNEKLELGFDATVDHIIPKSRGGKNIPRNWQWVTRSTNIMKKILKNKNYKVYKNA